MATHFSFSTGELDAGKGLVLAPGRTTAQDVIEAGWRALDAHNGWESFANDKIVIWRHSFAVSARFHSGDLVQIDCIWKDGCILKQDWSATDDDLLREKKTLAKLIKEEAQTTPVATSLGADTFAFQWGTISVRADQRSMIVLVSIGYSR
ncbi:hypothetical protein EN871_10130 [bacterium M00.F.Ca.ET.228.01.1.1]|nr:hypothetical protein EN871_10130 [bacterium M00.F.Ca.ET.228.01.1.1]TGS02807.1 hypothetical protein EN834_10125 [bacterium M00.F.Ca.ET.191.01.1.1]TGU06189.1 hypothetical protein EN798_14205 [bacterium M00.F.Ca.ET.155.01.1.1]